MFNKDQFIADYVEGVRTNNTEKLNEVLAQLTPEQTLEDRKEYVNEIISKVEELEGEHTDHVDFLKAQIDLIDTILVHEDMAKDSAGEDAKDDTKAEEVTEDVATAASAEEAEGDSAEAEAGAETETEAESGGYAPAKEEEEGKEQDK